MTSQRERDQQARHGNVSDRRNRERRIWWFAFGASVLLHVLIFLLGPSGSIPASPFAAAGPLERDFEAAEGALRAVALSSAPPEPIQPPVLPEVEVTLPETESLEPESDPEIEVEVPDLPDPGVGATEGDDADETTEVGIAEGPGAGDAGTADEGVSRLVPPSPRGMIIPPTHQSLRGREIEVWVFVNEDGRVVADSTELRPPTSDRGFNEQLIREAARWVFDPARRDGVPVSAWFPYTISM